MTLDEAIKHCEEKAEHLRNGVRTCQSMSTTEQADCLECANEHEQLAEWLEDYKRLLEEKTQGDLISRSELKKCAIPCQIHNGALTDLCVPLYQIDNAPTVQPKYFPPCEDCNKKIEEIRQAYDKMKVMKRPQGEWIAVKDKLPDTDGEYLVSLDNGRIVTADGRGIIDNHDFAPKMLAWQPLPEPYKKGGADVRGGAE